MALESGTYIDDLVETNPLSTDPKSQGDDHIRLIKKCILNSFPNVAGAMTLTEAQLNDAAQKAATATVSALWNFTVAPTISGASIATKTVTHNYQNGNYTCVLSDAGGSIIKQSGGAGETLTIPSNASVAYPIGTAIMFVNQGGGTVSIGINTDTMTLEGDGATGTRTLADDGICTAYKVSSTGWIIAGGASLT
jgi:hypothetical protein